MYLKLGRHAYKVIAVFVALFAVGVLLKFLNVHEGFVNAYPPVNTPRKLALPKPLPSNRVARGSLARGSLPRQPRQPRRMANGSLPRVVRGSR